MSFCAANEAGCLGYTLFQQLQERGYPFVILAPTTIASSPAAKMQKTDRRDALNIAKCLAHGTYSAVYVPTEDNAEEYIRTRDDAKMMVKQTMQQIIALCARDRKRFDGRTNWTQKHFTWFRVIELGEPVLQEMLSEHIAMLKTLIEKVERVDRRIEALAQKPNYAGQVKQLYRLKGIKTHTASSLVVEIGDFDRFPSAG